MKKYIILLVVSLLLSLFIYVFYRTDRTLVNQVIISMVTYQNYSDVKATVSSALPLNDYIIFSLPEGLWVFCITVTSGFFYVNLGNRKWRLEFIPLIMAMTMEIFQFFHFTNGRFDLLDIIFASGFWLLAMFCIRDQTKKEPLFQSPDLKTVCCMMSYFIVYLAHVTG